MDLKETINISRKRKEKLEPVGSERREHWCHKKKKAQEEVDEDEDTKKLPRFEERSDPKGFFLRARFRSPFTIRNAARALLFLRGNRAVNKNLRQEMLLAQQQPLTDSWREFEVVVLRLLCTRIRQDWYFARKAFSFERIFFSFAPFFSSSFIFLFRILDNILLLEHLMSLSVALYTILNTNYH